MKLEKCCSPFAKHMIILFPLTFLIVLPILSLYVDIELSSVTRNKEMTYNEWRMRNNQRIRKAEKFLNSFPDRNINKINPRVDKSGTSVAIVIISSSRHQSEQGQCNLKYSTQALSKFLELLRPLTTKDVQYSLRICFMDDSTIFNPEIYRLSKFVPIYTIPYQLLSLESFEIDEFEQEKLDYLFCAKNAIKEDTQFVLMTYDYMFPTINLSAVLRNILIGCNSVINRTDISYVKLYHPEKLISYMDEFERLSDLLCLSLLSLLVTLIYKYTCAYRSLITKTIFITFFIYMFLLIMFIGRKNIRTISPHLYQIVSAPPNHLEAVLYKRDKLSRFVQYLETKNNDQRFSVDSAIYNISIDLLLSPKLVQPNLMTNLVTDY